MNLEFSKTWKSKTAIIAIDGPSGAGKTTIAKSLSERIGIEWLSSGALYRAVTRLVIDQLGVPCSKEKLISLVKNTHWQIKGNSVMANKVDITSCLNSSEVDGLVTYISSIIEIREFVNLLLHNIIEDSQWIVEGRDIGTEVFPDAILKIFLDARTVVRVGRRQKERKRENRFQSDAEIADSLTQRDCHDRQKLVGSLRRADQAYIIDTTHLTIAEVCDTVVKLVPSNFFLE